MSKLKILSLCFFIFLIFILYLNLNQYFDVSFFIDKKQDLDSLYENSPFLFILSFFAFYVFCAALSIPGAAILTLVAGFLFNFFIGVVVISLGSTMGATLAFLISRFLLKDFIQKKFHARLKSINEGFKKEGAFYVFSLRLIPVFPFFVVNSFMGVTSISIRHFVVASFLGMLPGTFVYINAGSRLAEIESPMEIISLPIILSFILLAGLPWIMKFIFHLFGIKLGSRGNKD